MLLDKWCPRADLNHRHEDFQKRWHYLTQQYQRIKSQKQWCAIYCAIGCHLRPTQKHCVQHREVAIDWLVISKHIKCINNRYVNLIFAIISNMFASNHAINKPGLEHELLERCAQDVEGNKSKQAEFEIYVDKICCGTAPKPSGKTSDR
jgi:hypothetical protein